MDALTRYLKLEKQKKIKNGEEVAMSARMGVLEEKVDFLIHFLMDTVNFFNLITLKTEQIARLTRTNKSTVSRWFKGDLRNINEGGKGAETTLAHLLQFLKQEKKKVEIDLEYLKELGGRK